MVRRAGRVIGGWTDPAPTPPGPGRSCGPPWCRVLGNAASWPIRARFLLISYKVSQNGGVSPNYVEKAYVSPYFQNGAQKSPLDFLGFPFPVAFSHKELMGGFERYLGVYCQNDEVSPVCTPWSSTRRGRQYPQKSPQQAAPGDFFLIVSARAA